MTSCFVYKVMGLAFHDRINIQLIYRFELAQVVARRITKPLRFFRLKSHWLLFSFILFSFFFIFGGGGLILLFSSYLFRLFIYFKIIIFLYIAKWRNHSVVY